MKKRDEIHSYKIQCSICFNLVFFSMMLTMMLFHDSLLFIASFTAGETYRVVLPLWSNPPRRCTKKCMKTSKSTYTLVRPHVVPPPAYKTHSQLLLRRSHPARHCLSLLPSPARNRGYACGGVLCREHQAIPRSHTPVVSPTSGCDSLARWRCPR